MQARLLEGIGHLSFKKDLEERWVVKVSQVNIIFFLETLIDSFTCTLIIVSITNVFFCLLLTLKIIAIIKINFLYID